MRPTFIRRIHRKPATAKDSSVFRKEGQKEHTFFGEVLSPAFFQPSSFVQRKEVTPFVCVEKGKLSPLAKCT